MPELLGLVCKYDAPRIPHQTLNTPIAGLWFLVELVHLLSTTHYPIALGVQSPELKFGVAPSGGETNHGRK